MSAIPTLKTKLRNLIPELYPEAQAYRGAPPADQPRDLALLGAGRADITKPTAGGPRRSREEGAELTVIVSAYRPGDSDESQQQASEAAWAMADLLNEYLRTRGNETLDGACREAWVSEWEDSDYRMTDSDGNVTGRATDITITITADTRI